MNWILKVFGKVFAFLNGSPAGGIIKDAITAVLERSKGELVDLLFSEAVKRVQMIEVASPGADGATKRADVAHYLEQLLIEKGLPAGKSLINYAIESAIQALKK